jgi:hypothetical protein
MHISISIGNYPSHLGIQKATNSTIASLLCDPSGCRCTVQWKPLNVITLGQRESENINRMITISDCLLIQSDCLLVILDLINLGKFDHINRVITLSVITLSGLHCNLKSKGESLGQCFSTWVPRNL